MSQRSQSTNARASQISDTLCKGGGRVGLAPGCVSKSKHIRLGSGSRIGLELDLQLDLGLLLVFLVFLVTFQLSLFVLRVQALS